MPVCSIPSAVCLGLDPILVGVEVDVVADDKPSVTIVGLPDAAVKEAKDRVIAALRNSGHPLGDLACTINLAPGTIRKEGPLYDLPIALGIVSAKKGKNKGSPQERNCEEYLIVGELGLGGETRSIRGALPMAMLARQMHKRGIILPAANAFEAAAVPGIEVIPIQNLREAINFLNGSDAVKPLAQSGLNLLFKNAVPTVDMADVKGQAQVKRAMEIAAVGNHNVLLSGPPGCGKTMLAHALVGIIPRFTLEEALETTKVHSIAGFLKEGQTLVTQRPFRAPHHTVSYAGLIGGGAIPRPGEVALAHNGVLFLDELPEFARSTLEVLRQPLEDRQVTISRALGNFTFPTRFICVAAMNPCPCGYRGHPDRACKDSTFMVERYRAKISGPLLDRLDLHVDVPPVRYMDIASERQEESSAQVRARVEAAREIQYKRFGQGRTNGDMTTREIARYCKLDGVCQGLMRDAVEVMTLSARGHQRVLRVARSIADLDGSEGIKEVHLMEALTYWQQSFEQEAPDAYSLS